MSAKRRYLEKTNIHITGELYFAFERSFETKMINLSLVRAAGFKGPLAISLTSVRIKTALHILVRKMKTVFENQEIRLQNLSGYVPNFG